MNGTAAPYSVILVDDHRILREGIRVILEQTKQFRVVGESDRSSAVMLCEKLQPDVVVIDLGVP